MRSSIIWIVVETLETIAKSQTKRLKKPEIQRTKSVQTTALLRRCQKNWRDLPSLGFHWSPAAVTGMKIQRVKYLTTYISSFPSFILHLSHKLSLSLSLSIYHSVYLSIFVYSYPSISVRSCLCLKDSTVVWLQFWNPWECGVTPSLPLLPPPLWPGVVVLVRDPSMGHIKSKLATVVEGDQKAPFSIATTPRCWGGRYSFPWIAPFYPWYVHYIAECYQVPFLTK